MALYPKIQSPCRYKGSLSDILDGDICRLCKREVFDLTAMTDGERVSFMRSCNAEVCVSYRVRPAIAAAVFSAALMAPTMAAACDGADIETVVVGGIKKPQHVTYVETGEAPADRAIPALPVSYEDPARKPAAAPAPSSDTPHAAVTRPAAP
jgi:predicted Fe-S protein YdhL (DUF1289 family)